MATRYGEAVPKEAKETAIYDLKTAVTFLLIGVGLGALAAMVWSPRSVQFVGLNDRRDRGREGVLESKAS